MKKTWYIWFSVIGFMFMYFFSAIQIIFKIKDFHLWIRFCGKSILLLVSLIFFGIVLTTVPSLIIPNPNYIVKNIIDAVILLYVYFYGVFITYSLHVWKTKNITK